MLKRIVSLPVCFLFLLASDVRSQNIARPEFRPLLPRAEYLKALSALDSVDLNKLSKRSMAPCGYRLDRVDAEGNARNAGLRTGDLLFRINGRFVWHGIPDPSLTRDLEFYRRDEDRHFRLRYQQPFDFIVSAAPVWIPDGAWVSALGDRIESHPAIYAGLTRCQDAPNFAETAFHHGISNGYKADVFTDQAGVVISLARNEFEKAEGYAAAVEAAPKQLREWINPWVLVRTYLAVGRYTDLARIAEEFGLTRHMYSEQLAEYGQLDRRTSPNVSATSYVHINRTSELRPLSLRSARFLEGNHSGWSTKVISAATGAFNLLNTTTETPVRNFELTVEFKSEATDGQISEAAKQFVIDVFGISDDEVLSDADALSRLISVGFQERGGLRLTAPGIDTRLQIGGIRAPVDTVGVYRVIRIDDLLEVYFNDNRVLRFPVEPKLGRIVIELSSAGRTTQLSDLKFVELVRQVGN